MLYRETELKKIIEFYGEKAQTIKAIEELSELTKELCKYLNGQIDEKAIKEEMADVQVMLNQLILIFNSGKLDMERRMNIKIKRTTDIIDGIGKKK